MRACGLCVYVLGLLFVFVCESACECVHHVCISPLLLFLHSSTQGLTDERIQEYWKEYQPHRRSLFAFHQVTL